MLRAKIYIQEQGMQLEIELKDNSEYLLQAQLDRFLDWKKNRGVSKEVPIAAPVNTDEDVPF
jgi:hypothetical protein